MLKNIIPISILLSLIGCGGSSDDTASDVITVDTANVVSTASFYVSPWQSKEGVLKTLDKQGNVLLEQAVEDINAVTIDVDSLRYHFFEFEPTQSVVVCPSFDGCGRITSGSENDVNGNSRIDYQEPVLDNFDYKVSFFASPGENKIYFSPLTTIMADKNLSPTTASLAATPFYHLTHIDLNSSLEAEVLTNALTYGAILAGVNVENFSLNTALETHLTEVETAATWTQYARLSQQFISENLLDEQGNGLIQSVVGEVRQKIANLADTRDFSLLVETDQQLESRELLVDVRNILGVARLQEQKYSDELEGNLTEIENAIDTDSEQALRTLTEVLMQVLDTYSPLTSADPGVYKIDGLDINYSTGPFSWQITGNYQGVPVNIDLLIPRWRISGVLGDRIEGTMNATVVSGESTLVVDTKEIFVQTQGSNDPFSTEEVPETGVANIETEIALNKGAAQISGQLSAALSRIITPFDEVTNVLSSLDFKGQFNSDRQQTDFHILASEATPFIDEVNANLVFSVFLKMPLNGAAEFELAHVGDIQALDNLTSGEVFIRLKNRPVDLHIRNVGSNINAIIKGSHGRWLDVKQKGKSYSGGLYFGNVKIGQVKAVRGIPGVLFPDGTFESLF